MKAIFGKETVEIDSDQFGIYFKNRKSFLNFWNKAMSNAIKTNFNGDPKNWAAIIETEKYIFAPRFDELTVIAREKRNK